MSLGIFTFQRPCEETFELKLEGKSQERQTSHRFLTKQAGVKNPDRRSWGILPVSQRDAANVCCGACPQALR